MDVSLSVSCVLIMGYVLVSNNVSCAGCWVSLSSSCRVRGCVGVGIVCVDSGICVMSNSVGGGSCWVCVCVIIVQIAWMCVCHCRYRVCVCVLTVGILCCV